MIKKELREIIFPTLIRLGVFLVFFMAILIYHNFTIGYSLQGLLFFVSSIVIYWIANHFGISAFKPELRDHALEYLLTFPFSKWRIIFAKVTPRIIILLVLIIGYWVTFFTVLGPLLDYETLYKNSGRFIIYPFWIPIWIIFLFLCGFFVGLFDWKDWRIVMGFIHTLFAIIISLGIKSILVHNSFSPRTQLVLYGTSFGVGCLLVMAIMGISFISVFRKFDLKSMKIHRKKFLIRAYTPMTLLTVLSVVFLIWTGNK